MTAPVALNSAPAVVVRRCNPFGHATGAGPKHLMGGLYGPEYEGRIKWECKNPSDGSYVMECRHGHKGQPMELCLPHVAMIQRRMAGCCPRCAMPPIARGLFEDIKRAQGAYAAAYMAGVDDPAILRPLQTRADDLAEAMNELVRNGTVHRCPLTITERS